MSKPLTANPQVPCQPHYGDLVGCTNSSSLQLLANSNVKSVYFQAEEKQRRENLEKIMAENQRKIEEQNKNMVSDRCNKCFLYFLFLNSYFKAEERLKIIEEQMKIDQEKQKLKRKEEKRAKNEQKKILGKDNSRPKLSFALSSAI